MKIVIYSKNNCQFCTKAKHLVKTLGLEYVEKSLEKGSYTSLVEFPEDLLFPIGYSLKLILWNNFSGSYYTYDVNEKIRFKPIETPSLMNNTPGGRSGTIALKCKWEIAQ